MRVALLWTPQGKRKQDRPQATWRRTVEKEIKAIGLTWGEAEMAVLDKICWRQRVGGLIIFVELRSGRRLKRFF